MKNKTIKSVGIALVLSMSLVACQQTSPVATKGQEIQSFSSEKIITGKVEFPTSPIHHSSPTSNIHNFSSKATQSDIVSQASVSLLYPPDHSDSGLRNSTVAVGLSDSSGNFRLNPDSSFQPAANSIFILEARKRLSGDGSAVLSLKTFVQWTGTSWTSITGNNIFINTKTTAVCIMSGHNPSLLSPSESIGKFSVSDNTTTTTNINNNVDTFKIAEVDTLVNDQGNLVLNN